MSSITGDRAERHLLPVRGENDLPRLRGDGQMSVDSSLRAQARKLMRARKLPNRLPDRMWGGPGVGSPCTVCGAPVKQDETELEVEWSDGASTSNHQLHVCCFAALELEIREGELPQRTLGASGQLESVPAPLSAAKPEEAA